jgi:hypothetical protein
MSILTDNGSGINYWNYSNPEKDGYSLELTGDVVQAIQTQDTEFKTKKPLYWHNSKPQTEIVNDDPVLSWSLAIIKDDGTEVRLDRLPKPGKQTKENPKQIQNALAAALKKAGVADEIGQNVTFKTKFGVTIDGKEVSFQEAKQMRQWEITINGPATHEARPAKYFDKISAPYPDASESTVDDDSKIEVYDEDAPF